MKLSLTSVVIVGASVIAGALAGQTLLPSSSHGAEVRSVSERPVTPRRVRVPHIALRTAGIDRATLRAEIDAALVRHRAGPNGGAADGTVTPAPAPVTDTQRAAATAGQATVDDAVSRGTWTDDDRMEFVSLAPRMHGDDAHKLLVRVAAAINRGDLIPEGDSLL